MSKQRIKLYRLDVGLNTSADERSGFPGVYQILQNVRLSAGPASVRKGMKRVAVIAPTSTADIVDFDGSGVTVQAQALGAPDVWPLGTVWTVEFLCQADTLAGDIYILGDAVNGTRFSLRIKQTSSNTIVASTRDSGLTTVTLTSAASYPTGAIVAGQVVRNGTSLTMRINNATEVTGTMSALVGDTQVPAIGVLNGGNFYDGRIEWVRGFSVAKTNQNDCWNRLVNPRAPDVIFDYVTSIDAGTGYVLDRSRFENHMDVAGTPATTSTLLGNLPVPIQSLSGMLSRAGSRKLVAVARGLTYTGSY